MMASRSMTPKKLSTQSLGRGEQQTRAIYSKVKKKVRRYSSTSNVSLKVRANSGIVSINEMMILSEIATINTKSKIRPMGTSDSNIILYSFSFSSHLGFFIFYHVLSANLRKNFKILLNFQNIHYLCNEFYRHNKPNRRKSGTNCTFGIVSHF